jgi:hypothetical protein
MFTMVFRGKEFICLRDGRLYTYFGPPTGADPTPELEARCDALKAEFTEHAKALICAGMYLESCPKCHTPGQLGEHHALHATDEEWAASDAALAWLNERTGRTFTSTNGVLA